MHIEMDGMQYLVKENSLRKPKGTTLLSNLLGMPQQACPSTEVTINEKVFSISEYTIDDIATQGNAAHGYMLQKNQAICYNSGQHLQQIKDTILHEILHGIDFDSQLNMSETQVHALATNLLALFWNEDNKALTNWLLTK